MGDVFKSGAGNQGRPVWTDHIRQDQASVTELLVLLGMAQRELTKLPVSEPIREEAKNSVRSAQREARKKKPDKERVVVKLKNAAEILGAVPKSVTAAVKADDLLRKGLEVCVDLIL